MSLQMCLLWKCSVQFLLKPTLSAKSTQQLKKGCSSHCQRNVGENLADSELVPTVNGTGTATVRGERATLLVRPMFGSLYLTNAGTGIFL
jgi:hypothetical protein